MQTLGRGMTVVLSALAVVVFMAQACLAVPGEQRVIQGILVWPSVVTPGNGSPEGFIVVRGDDGRTYFADVVVALRARPIALQAGNRVQVVGVESARPHVLTAITVGPGSLPTSFPSALPRDAVAPPVAAAPQPDASTSAPAATPPARDQIPAESRDRGLAETVSGRVESFSKGTLTLRTGDGRVLALDMSAIGGGDALRAGDEVTVIGRRDSLRGFVASGFIQEMPAAGSALPRQPR